MSGSWACEVWSILQPGQAARAAAPLPPGSVCTTAVVDQASHRWICATSS